MTKILIYFFVPFLLFGCEGDKGIREYTKKKPSTSQHSEHHEHHDHDDHSGHDHGEMPDNHPPVNTQKQQDESIPEGAPLVWKKPEGWQPLKASMMHLANYSAPGEKGEATCGVFVFPGDGGGVLDNINRWRKQMALENITQSDLPNYSKPVSFAGYDAFLVDYTGNYQGMVDKGMNAQQQQQNYRLLGIISITPKGSVFIKMVGPEQTVAHQQQNFETFYKSFEFRER